MMEENARGKPRGEPKKKKEALPHTPPAKAGDVLGLRALDIRPAHPAHRGEAVKVGEYEVLAGGTRDLTSQDLEKADVLVPLLNDLPPMKFGRSYQVLAAPLADYGGVPVEWGDFLRKQVIPLLATGKRVLAFCMGSHGRTGCFLASLIALLETPEQTPDPIAAARERHCHKAVESREQAEAVFALRGQPLPAKYEMEFRPRIPLGFSEFGGHVSIGRGLHDPTEGPPGTRRRGW